MRRVVATLVLGLCLATTVLSARGLDRLAPRRQEAIGLLYLPNGRYLRAASLGQAPLLADLLYIWAIQFYSDYGRADRFRYVYHVFGNVIAELDPHYVDAYWMGALILIVEAHDFEGGLALLDRGIAANPDKWILSYLAAWESWLAGQPDRAAAYFDLAVAVPTAPQSVRRMRAAMVSRAGRLEDALALWQEILDDPTSDATSVSVARAKVRDLRVEIDLRELSAAIDRFREDNSRNPASLAELAQRRYIRSVPRHPDGAPYAYDPKSGRVSGPAGRVLGESG